MKNYQTISIQFTKNDAYKLIAKAKQNRLKLSSYPRQLITKDLNLDRWYLNGYTAAPSEGFSVRFVRD